METIEEEEVERRLEDLIRAISSVTIAQNGATLLMNVGATTRHSQEVTRLS